MPERRQREADRPDQIKRKRGVVIGGTPVSLSIEECLEHARQCGWYAARTNDEEDRKFLLRKAKIG